MFSRAPTVHRRRMRLLLPLTLAVIGLLLSTSVGWAHSNLERSDPANGAILRQSPGEVRLWFTEDLEPDFTRAVVYDGNRQPVSTLSHVAPENPRLLLVELKPHLTNGWYVISWQAQAKLDGHLTRGAVPFGIGVAGPPPDVAAAANAAQSGSGSLLEVALRWLILLSTIVIVGSFAFWEIQSLGLARGSRVPTRVRILPTQWALAELAWILFMLVNVIFLIDVVAVASDAPSLDDLGPPLILLATRTTFGQLWLARMALASFMGIILLYRGNRCPSPWDRVALVIGGGLLLSFSLTSHSATVSNLAPIAVANDWLHFAAVTVWIGGLLQLAIVFTAPAKASAQSNGSDIRWNLVRRFAAIATYALAMVGVTGLSEAIFHVVTPFNLVHSGYGQMVVLKTVLLIPLVALAAVHHRLILPALIRQTPEQTPPFYSRLIGSRSLESWFARSIRLEALWAVLLIAAVGLLTSLSPP
ncbi:MAG TPA: copper resistance protein CopC [Chloroflexota bacterium]|nr:copper resistance protein CopC [Chloroflexota bacterium]